VKLLSVDPLGVAFAFTAGAFALFSPCSFPMFPGYISYYIGSRAPLERAIIGGIACTLGLLAVFSLIGVIASMIGSFVYIYMPFLELIAGIVAIILGLGMIVEIELPMLPIPVRAPKQRTLIGIFFYGVAYGLAALGCSAPIFFSVLFYSVVSGGLLYGMFIFIVYAFGMGFPLIMVTIILSRARGFISRRIVKATPLLHRLSGMIIVLIGVYLIYYYFMVLGATAS